jgi:hypothetical protein
MTLGIQGNICLIQVWRWQEGCTKLHYVRNLTGHSGRVEALALDAEGRRAASSGKDSSLKVSKLRHHNLGSEAYSLSGIGPYPD